MIAFSAQPTLADAEFGAGHLLQVIVGGVPKRQLDLPGHPYVIRGVG